MISNVILRIKNFKSIKSKTVHLNSDGMTLIKGPSGAGKSTIIESVLYAVTGKPKSCKPLGTNLSVNVSLTFETADGESWNITRSTRPGRLLLERKGKESVEDDEAQALIKTIFGDKFDVVSYIPQNTGQSFMKMTPTAKLNFLEQLTFGPDVAILKKKSKAYLTEKKTESTRANAKHSLRLSDLKRVAEPTREEESLPEKPKYDTDPQALKSSARAEIKKFQDRIDSATSSKKAMENRKNKRDASRMHIQTIEEEIKELEEELDVDGDILEVLANSKEAYLAAKKMEALRRNLPGWAQGKNWEDEHNQCLDRKQKKIDKVGRDLKKAESRDTAYFECPSCSDLIGYNYLTCKTVTGPLPEAPLCGQEASIRDLMRTETKRRREFEDRKEKGELAMEVYKKISALNEEWGEGVLDDLQELEDAYTSLKELSLKYSRLNKLKKKVVENADPEFDMKVEKLEADVKEMKKELSKHQKAFDKADAVLDLVQEWKYEVDKIERRNETVRREKTDYKEAVEREAKAAADLLTSSKMLKGAEELKAAVLEAESLALVFLVNEINDNAAAYLDAFFAEDPIEVSLKTFSEVKSTKKIKPSIKTEIQYKGNDMTLDALSGGEQARVIIAFMLALCDIQQSPVVMLDEVTANLDADLTEIIFDTVKSATSGKIVIAVAHQCVDGVFQTILKII